MLYMPEDEVRLERPPQRELAGLPAGHPAGLSGLAMRHAQTAVLGKEILAVEAPSIYVPFVGRPL